MIVFSKNIVFFINRLRKMADAILAREVGVSVSSRNHHFLLADHYYSFSINIFEGRSSLGYFDPALFEIGINRTLIYTAKDTVLRDILRHEIAHMIVHIQNQSTDENGETAHGHGFKSFCRSQGWGINVLRASGSVDSMNNSSTEDNRADNMIRKVKKLLRLAESSNPHEAELATIKANQILLDYNLTISKDEAEAEEKVFYTHRVLTVKRRDAKFKAISQILGTFYVMSVSHRGVGLTHLEATGRRANVKIAAYVARFLNNKLDDLWSETRKEHPHLKGIAAKNSFLRGVGQGYVDKINRVKTELPTAQRDAIMVVESQLEEMVKMAYSHLSTTSSTVKHHGESNSLGKIAGKKLTIHKPVAGNSSEIFLPG